MEVKRRLLLWYENTAANRGTNIKTETFSYVRYEESDILRDKYSVKLMQEIISAVQKRSYIS